MVVPDSTSPTFPTGKGCVVSSDITLIRPLFWSVYEEYSVPPRRVGFCFGPTVTQISSYAVVAPVTRVSAICTRVPSSAS